MARQTQGLTLKEVQHDGRPRGGVGRQRLPNGCAENTRHLSRTPMIASMFGLSVLFRLVRMLGVHLLEEDVLTIDIEPDPCVPLCCGLVLPTHVRLAATLD